MRVIGVVGAGTMGSGIAQVFAQSGMTVRLHDTSRAALDNGRRAIDKSLAKFVEKGATTAAARDETIARLPPTTTLDDLADVDYIVEAIVETIEAKRDLFHRLDTLTSSHTILASNTSSI